MNRKEELAQMIRELEDQLGQEQKREAARLADLKEQLKGTKAYLKRKQDAERPNPHKAHTAEQQIARLEQQIAAAEKGD
jgi:hypothetical protein